MRDPKAKTLRDVALQAGVSTATASHALNNTRPVGRDARQRVLEAARALGYRPNILARSLKTGSSRLIGCLVSNLSNPLISAAVEGANALLQGKGYGLLVYRAGPESLGVTRGMELAASYRAAGLLVIHPDASHSPALRRWVSEQRPVVLTIHPHPSLAADHVIMAEEEAGYAATRYLIEAGHRRIAILSRPVHLEVYARVLVGHRQALAEAGIRFERSLLRCRERAEVSNAVEELGYRETMTLLGRTPRPTAILCAHNQIAIGTLRALRDRGVRVPEQMSLASFDEVDWMNITEPAITSIGIRGEALGEAAAAALLRRLDGSSAEARIIRLKLTLTPRNSVSAPGHR